MAYSIHKSHFSPEKRIDVGGQAVIEGVMMRAPKSLVISVRRPSGEIVSREDRWVSIIERFKFLRWPFFRGTIVLIEAMVNGIQALSYSANQAMEESITSEKEEKLSKLAITGTLIFAFVLGIVIFVMIPHALTEVIGERIIGGIYVDSILFHIIDGIIRIIFFVGYIVAISYLKDIKRVFQYHGAEHKSIFAYENGEELTIENAKKYKTFHARCGTSFLILVLLISIFLFTAVYPFLPRFELMPRVLRSLIYIFIKIPLLLPIAGISYEIIKFASKTDNPLFRWIITPGLWLQRITTSEPDDSQLEVALCSLKKVLELEKNS